MRASNFDIASGLDATPVNGVDGRSFRLATVVTLYNPATYETAADAWVSYRDGLAAGQGGDLPQGAPVPSAGDNSWSVELLDERFGDRSRLLTVDGSGHGVFALGTNPCAHEVVADYLVDGDMPETDVQCPPATP